MNRAQRFFLRIGALAAKEALHILRDVRTLYLALVMPVVMLLIFGYGVSFDIDQIPIAVLDLDRSATSRELVRRMVAPGEVILGAEVDTAAQGEHLVTIGKVLGLLTIPARASEDLAAGKPVTLQLAVDGSDGVVANQVLSKTEALARSIANDLVGVSGTPSPPMQVKMWTRYNPQARSVLFMVPGLSAYLLAIAAVMLTALAVAGEWERGSMEQLFASPVGRLEIIVGKLLPYLAVGMLQLLLVLALGTWAFDVPIRGSVWLLLLVGFLFLVGMLGQGLLISVIAKNQMVATQAGALSSLLPSMLLSGFVIPIENMPTVLQGLSHIVAARYLVHALRALMLKGAAFSDISRDLVALIIFAVFVLGVATARFRRRLA